MRSLKAGLRLLLFTLQRQADLPMPEFCCLRLTPRYCPIVKSANVRATSLFVSLAAVMYLQSPDELHG